VFLTVINLFLFIQVCNFLFYVISHYLNKSKNKLKSELRVEMLSAVDMEMAGFLNLVLCTQLQRNLQSAPSGQQMEASSSETAVHIFRVDGVVSPKTTVTSLDTDTVVTLPETNDGKGLRLVN